MRRKSPTGRIPAPGHTARAHRQDARLQFLLLICPTPDLWLRSWPVYFRAVSRHPPILQALACPTCRGSWRVAGDVSGDGFALLCDRCRLRVAVLDGFPLFTEREIDDGSPSIDFVAQVRQRAFGSDAGGPEFRSFCSHKRRRGVVDAYAAWAPFNESGRTPLSFVSLLREHLRPGDVILDLSSRSGWTGEFLAGLFPTQRVISAWEGNKDCLGYRGFRQWLPRDLRAGNLDIAFFDPREPLPIADGAVRFVHGYDILHELQLERLWPELLRVAGPEGVLLFPHVHLHTPDHDPSFERHGRLLEGSDYRRVLGKLLAGGSRRACVMGEATMFAAQKAGEARTLCDEPESPDYNAVVAVVPASWIGRPLAVPVLPAPLESAAVLPNPLLEVSATDGSVRVSCAEGMSEMPGRHPVYARLLPAALEPPLSPRERVLHFWSGRVATVGELAKRMGEVPEALAPVLADLERREIVKVAAVSRGAYRLQRFHARLEDAPLADEDDLVRLWRRAVADFGDRVYLVDDSDGGRLTYLEADRIVSAIARRSRAAGVRPGDRIALCAPQHFEGMLLFWAAACLAAPLAIIDAALPPAVISERLHRLKPALLFAAGAVHAALPVGPGCTTVLLDPAGDVATPAPASTPTLMAWLRDEDYEGPTFESTAGLADFPAAILFTSGTTGEARGVMLSQRALSHSGRLMARLFDWTEDDVHICPADLHTLGGLRNPVITAVHAGASTVVTSPEVRANMTTLVGAMTRHRVTLVNATPALLRLLTSWADRMPPGALSSVRHMVVAGSALTSGVRLAFERVYRVPTSNCYGLTETAGLCISESPETRRAAAQRDSDQIGRAVDTILRVVGDDGRDVPAGTEGELWIHNANLFSGYLDNPAATEAAFSGKWFRSRDRARLTTDGECLLGGRSADAIKNAWSEFVSAREVQEALDGIPEVADSGVGAWTDDQGQEHLGAIVVPREAPRGPAESQALVAQLLRRLQEILGARRMPSRLVIRDSVPRNSNGKVATGPEMRRNLFE